VYVQASASQVAVPWVGSVLPTTSSGSSSGSPSLARTSTSTEPPVSTVAASERATGGRLVPSGATTTVITWVTCLPFESSTTTSNWSVPSNPSSGV
jgi:hypothetical protein